MKILNIHGYNGEWNNTNYQILKDAGFCVVSPQLDYKNTLAEDIGSAKVVVCSGEHSIKR